MEAFTLAELVARLRKYAGQEESVDLDGDIADAAFDDLGYDSLALLNTIGSIEREYGVGLDDDTAAKARTPRQLVDMVNSRLGQSA